MERSPELRDLTLRLYEAMSRGDVSFFERVTSRQEGLLAIGTDPAEWWDSYDRLAQAFRTQVEEMGGALPVVGGDPQAYQEGSVGWVADRAIFTLPGGPDIPFRLTTVWHREGGDWKLVQWHISLGVANEEAVGKELTI